MTALCAHCCVPHRTGSFRSDGEAIVPDRVGGEELVALLGGEWLRDREERLPHCAHRAEGAVGRKVRREHTTVDAEDVDRFEDVGTDRFLSPFRDGVAEAR